MKKTTDKHELKQSIDKISDEVSKGNLDVLTSESNTIKDAISQLDQGKIRVVDKIDNSYHVNAWVKDAILHYFRIMPMEEIQLGPYTYRDKIPLKSNFKELNVRVVPPATVRFGSFLEPGVVVMPSYVNIGAWVGSNTMIDTWVNVGSCAQIGSGVHLSVGVGIGGVLEPSSAKPVIIEDGAFVGSGCSVVEGVHIGEGAVLAANVSLTASTPIIDTRNGAFSEIRGAVPPRAVVLPGNKEKEVKGGKILTNCAYIVGERSESTDRKTSLNQVLREFSVSV